MKHAVKIALVVTGVVVLALIAVKAILGTSQAAQIQPYVPSILK